MRPEYRDKQVTIGVDASVGSIRGGGGVWKDSDSLVTVTVAVVVRVGVTAASVVGVRAVVGVLELKCEFQGVGKVARA